MVVGGHQVNRKPPQSGIMKNVIVTVLMIPIDLKKIRYAVGAQSQKVCVITGEDGNDQLL